MKKFILQSLMTVMCLFIVSCSGGGGSSTPSAAAKKVCDAIVKKDADALITYVNNKGEKISATEMEEGKAFLAALIEEAKYVKYEILSEKLSQDGTKADVSVKFTDSDGVERTDDIRFSKTDAGWKWEVISTGAL